MISVTMDEGCFCIKIGEISMLFADINDASRYMEYALLMLKNGKI